MNTKTPLRNQAMLDQGYMFEVPDDDQPIIKVIGVGGGGSNAVDHMFELGVRDVDFVVCNTDKQALMHSSVPTKLKLGELGAGTDPKKGKMAAEDNVEDIRHMLSSPTQMVFITAGMGGGTGTGAAPVIAKIARELGLLTIAVVTAPFDFEGTEKISQAMAGIEELKAHCDTVLVVLNDKLAEMYGELPLRQAFAKADDVLANAVKSIAEIITVRGDINVDFMDVKRVLEQAGQAVMGSADAEGKDRALQAIEEALNSPLLNDRDIRGAKRILLTMASSSDYETTMNEQRIITRYIQDKIGKEAWLFKHGAIIDESLGNKLRVTVIAAGFDLPKDKKDFPVEKKAGLNGPAVTTPLAASVPELEPELVDIDSQTPTSTMTLPGSYAVFEETDVVDEEPAPVMTVPELPSRMAGRDDIKRMIDTFVRDGVRDLDSPTFLRRNVVLHELPKMPDSEIIRSRLND